MNVAVAPKVAWLAGPPAAVAVVRVSLSNFRCYGDLRLEPGREPVVLTGPNGAGKTNLLEALSFLAPGRGLRRAKLGEVDRRAGALSTGPWAVATVVETPAGPVEIGTGREGRLAEDSGRTEKRIVKIDGNVQRGQVALGAQLAVIWMIPEMDRLFDDGPSPRRRFLDRLVVVFDPEHAGRIAAYEHALSERARLLAEKSGDAAWLDALEDTMARHGIAVAAARGHTAQRLHRAAAQGIGPFPSARIAVTGEVDRWLAEMPALAAEDRLRDRLAASRGADAETGGASAGPHRSDLDVRFAAKDMPARQCSTGEQKALLISMLLAQARELKAERGAPPLLLLDEVVAHLDAARRGALFDEIAALQAQAWLTGTDDELFTGLRGRARFFRVADATVTSR
jgi:DNA replication and repair protein RecF